MQQLRMLLVVVVYGLVFTAAGASRGNSGQSGAFSSEDAPIEDEDDATVWDSENYDNEPTALPGPSSPEDETLAQSNETTDADNAEINDTPRCDSPPIVEGTIPPRLRGRQHAVGTEVTYQCNFGFVSRSSVGFRSVCVFDRHSKAAKWTDLAVECIPRSCGDPGFVANAHRLGDLFTFPYKVEFRCHDGYQLQGQAMRFCQASGEWSGRLPDCKQIFCGLPTSPENGRVLHTSLEFGAELRYECDRGFKLANHQPRSCTGDGTWSNSDPVCIGMRCREPAAPVHGTVQLLGGHNVDSIAAFACDEGRTVVGASLAKCLITGQWTFPPPKCATSCAIPAVSGGVVGRHEVRSSMFRRKDIFVEFPIGTVVQHAETVDLQCKEGSSPAGAATGQRLVKNVTCEDGEWSKTLQCIPDLCLGDAPPMDHGTAVINERHHGHVIYYRCATGYVKGRGGHVECTNGTWIGHTPTCVDGRCYARDLNGTGLDLGVEYVEHSKGHPVSCAKGYRVTAKRKNVRCSKGKWNIPENACTEESCSGEPPQIEHGRVRAFSLVPGSEVNYECDPTFEMSRLQKVRCRLGEWTGDPPSCLYPTTIPSSSYTTTESSRSVESEEVTSSDRGTQDGTLRPAKADESSSSHPENCFCSYEYIDRTLIAEVGGNRLRYKDMLRNGDAAALSCRDPTKYQRWPNGLVTSGQTMLTCSRCLRWQETDLPTCINLRQGDSWIGWHDQLKLLPGGDIKLRPGETLTIPCHNLHVAYPTWSVSNGVPGSIQYSNRPFGDLIRLDSMLILSGEQLNREETYSCFAVDRYGQVYGSSILHLRLADDEIRCPGLDNKGIFTINYSNGLQVGSVARYSCKEGLQAISGRETRECLGNRDWSDAEPQCITDEVRCPGLDDKGIFTISYSNGQQAGSVARYSCKEDSQAISGLETRECLGNGDWSEPEPRCLKKEVACPELERSETFIIVYKDWTRKADSIAQYSCRSTRKHIVGPNTRICQSNGKWSEEENPICVDIKCPEFEVGDDGLQVDYSDGSNPISWARFSCLPPATLEGANSAMCRYNSSWSNPRPSCNDPCRSSPCQNGGTCITDGARFTCDCQQPFGGAHCETVPGCLIGELMENTPENVAPNLEGVSEELLPTNSELPLFCENNLILVGSKKAFCRPDGKWDLGKVECANGCFFNTQVTLELLIDPSKEVYGLGEFANLNCPDGLELTTDVERVMCIGSEWSNPIPDCRKVTDEDLAKNGDIKRIGS